MNKVVVTNLVRASVLILIQVLVLKRIAFEWGDFAFIHFIVYPLVVMLLPVKTARSLVLIIGFLIGLCIDMFYDSPGIHACALLTAAYVRPMILSALEPYEGYSSDVSPTSQSMGFTWFLLYASIFMGIHLLVYFSVEAFSFVFIFEIILNTIFSFIASLLLIMLGQFIFRTKY